jgi:hypothetical protein
MSRRGLWLVGEGGCYERECEDWLRGGFCALFVLCVTPMQSVQYSFHEGPMKFAH